tara:strand:- start:3878 stop:5074 length:1197 start_codon:yes stop_codon:yes gene_type:complete
MSKENTVPQEVTENQRPTAAPVEPELTPEAQQISTVLNAVKENPALASDPEIAKIMELVNENPGSNGQAASVSNQQAPPTTTESKSPFVDRNQTPTQQAENQQVEESVFFGKQQQAAQEPAPSDLSEVYDRINKKYSINTENGIDKFFNSVDTWRKQAQQSSKIERELNEVRQSFESMPQPLFNAFESWTRGEDWTSQIVKEDTYLDYTKPFANHDREKMISKYFGDDYSAEDIEDMDGKMKTRLSKLAEKQYTIEQQSFQTDRAKLQNARKAQEEQITSSVDSSLNILREEFPEFNNDALSEIRQALLSNQVDALFKNQDGNYSENAAKMLAFALYGDAENKRLMKVAKRRGESEATEKLVTRGSDTPSVKGSQINQPQDVNQVVKMFDGLFPKSTY